MIMKKILLLAAQFKLNLWSNIFFIIQCTLVFLLANSTVSSILYGGYVGRYYTNLDKDRTLFLSAAVKNNVQFGDPEGFYRLAEDICAIGGVSGVGYQMEESFLAGTNEDVIVRGLILGGDMAEIQYPLGQGGCLAARLPPAGRHRSSWAGKLPVSMRRTGSSPCTGLRHRAGKGSMFPWRQGLSGSCVRRPLPFPSIMLPASRNIQICLSRTQALS